MKNEKMFRKIERLVATIGGRYFTIENENSKDIEITIYNSYWYEIFRAIAYLYNNLTFAPIETPNKQKFVLVNDFCGFDVRETNVTITIEPDMIQFPPFFTAHKISNKDFEDYFIGD